MLFKQANACVAQLISELDIEISEVKFCCAGKKVDWRLNMYDIWKKRGEWWTRKGKWIWGGKVKELGESFWR